MDRTGLSEREGSSRGVAQTGGGKIPRRYNNGSDGGACHSGPNSWEAEKVYAGRIRQIRKSGGARNSREKIAELIGVTVGSLQVTCFEVGCHSSTTKVCPRGRIAAAGGTAFQWDRRGQS